ncbi:hypothetical protein Tco_0591666 [Tanacetum coccineum]
MTAGNRKPESQSTDDETKAANLNQRLKSLIMSVLPESRVMDLKLCYNTFKFKEGESLTQTFTRYKALMNELVNDGVTLSKLEINIIFLNGLPKKWLSFRQSLRNTNHVKDSELASLFGKLKCGENLIDNSLDDEEDTRSNQEYMNDLEKEFHERSLLSKSRSSQLKFFNSSQQKPKLRPTKDFEAKYNKVKAKLTLLSSGASTSKFSMVKNKCLVAEAYEWDEEDVSSDDNEMVKVKVKISMRKVHTLLEIEDNDEKKTFIDYLCIDLNYVEKQRNNLVLKHRDLVQELNTCKEQLLVLKRVKLDFLTMQHVNTEILKENQNLRKELKELTAITETWLNSSTKVNQYINEQIPSQKKRILAVDQHAEDPSSSGQTDLVFVKSSADDTIVSIPSVERHCVQVTDSLVQVTNYDSVDESSVCSTPLPLLEKLASDELISGPKTIKSIFKSNSTFKVETLECVTINKPTSAPSKGNKNVSASKNNSTPAGKLKNVKIKDDISLSVVMKELNDLKLQINKNSHLIPETTNFNMSQQNHFSQNKNKPRNPQHVTKSYETCDSTVHTTTNHNDIEWFRRGEALQAKKAESLNANRSKTLTKRKPIWYLDSGCSRHMIGVKSYLHKYVKQPGPKVVFRDDSTCTTEGYSSIKCNGIVSTKVAFVNDLKYNLISISQLCDAKYIVQFDEKKGIIFNSNKEVMMIAPRVRDVYVLDMTSSAQQSCFFTKASESVN